MKKQLLSFCILLLAVSGFSQNVQLSANLRQYLLKNQTDATNIVLNKHNGQVYLGAIIELNPDFEENQFSKLGVSVGTKIGNYRTVQIPVSQIRNFVQLKNIKVIQLDEPVSLKMDSARFVAGVDSIHRGIEIPSIYSGKNVVIGIIDIGFDYTHPTFYDTTGTRLRIKKVWEQKISGTPPKGFTYGNEISDTSEMLRKGTEDNSSSHATHVGGIAAGSGFGSPNNNKYRGIAYESDLVFVGINPIESEKKGVGLSSILDGISYIFNYAKEQNKPAVVNLSWGVSHGPNDGSSLFGKTCDLLTGEGRILVISAGNNGLEKIHIQKDFSQTDTALHSFIKFPFVNGVKRTWLDIWGESGKDFYLEFSLMRNNLISSKSEKFYLNNTNKSSYFTGKNNDTCFFTITTSASEQNGKPNIFVDLLYKSNEPLLMTIISKSGKVNAWLDYEDELQAYHGEFKGYGYDWAVDGDSKYTLGELACTKSALTVAAFISKLSYTNLEGNPISLGSLYKIGEIAPFSSFGPSADGTNKPDIAAPGMTIGSGVNSFDNSFRPNGMNYFSLVSKYTSTKNNRDYYYAEMSGTSMSSPFMSGIVALLLQVNPKLDPGRLKQILAETAIIDNFTTPTPDPTRWGFGKVNAYGAIKKTIQTLGISGELQEGVLLKIYPNPTNGKLYIDIESKQHKNLEVVLMDLNGKKLIEQNWNTGNAETLVLDLEGLQEAIYLVQIKSDTGIFTRRIIKSNQ